MKRYITVTDADDKVLCSIDTATGEIITHKGVTVRDDDYEDVFHVDPSGVVRSTYNNH